MSLQSALPPLSLVIHHALPAEHPVHACITALRSYHNTRVAATAEGCGSSDVPLGASDSISTLWQHLPPDYEPGLYLWFGLNDQTPPPDVATLNVPAVAILADIERFPRKLVQHLQGFDVVFAAQREAADVVLHGGMRNAFWLPPAYDPTLIPSETDRTGDVVFLGTPEDASSPRWNALLDTVRQLVPDAEPVPAPISEATERAAKARIVVCAGRGRTLNPLMVQAIGAGACVLTDDAVGLSTFFTPDEHLGLYETDAALPPLLLRYLDSRELCQTVAEQGSTLVKQQHTWAARAENLLLLALDAMGALGENGPDARFQRGGYYGAARPDFAAHVPVTARRILDCGCGAGDFGLGLKARGADEVVGIEIVEQAWETARRCLDDALLGNIETMDLPFEDEHFDAICFGDVLEHLIEPANVLKKVTRVLQPNGVIVMSIPNIQYFHTFDYLANGLWPRADAGIMDRTHLRFFTAIEIENLIAEAGLKLLALEPLSKFGAEQLHYDAANKRVQIGRVTLHAVTPEEFSQLETYQYLAIAARPEAEPLAWARQALEANHPEEAYRLAKSYRGGNECERRLIMGTAQARTGQLDNAERLYREALTLDETFPRARGSLGALLVAQGRINEAVPLLEQAVADDENDAKALGALGLAYVETGRDQEAFDVFARSLGADFQNESLLRSLIMLAEKLGRLTEIEAPVRRFCEFYPGNLDMLCVLALILADLGRRDEAREKLDTVLLFAPDHPNATSLAAQLDNTEPDA